MRTKVTLVLIFLNVALFFFIFKFERHWRTEAASLEARRRVLAGAETADIRTITVTSAAPGGSYSLEREAKRESWSLKSPIDWPANSSAVSAIVQELALLDHETSFQVKDLSKTGMSLVDYGLEKPKLTVAFTSGDASGPAQPTILQIGDSSRDGSRFYLLSPDRNVVHVVSRALIDRLTQPLEQLRADTLLTVKVFEARSLMLQATNPNQAGSSLRVRVRREPNARWIFDTPITARASNTAVQVVINQLNGLRPKTFDPKPEPAAKPSDVPALRVALEGNNRLETLYLGEPVPAAPGTPPAKPGAEVEYYAQLDGRSALFTVVVPTGLIEMLRNATEQLRDTQVLPFDRQGVTSITIAAPTPATTGPLILQRLEGSANAAEEPGWQVARRGETNPGLQTNAADRAAIKRVLDQLAGLTAKVFVSDAPSNADLENWGFNRPEREITLTLASVPAPTPNAAGSAPPAAASTTLVLQLGVDARRQVYARVPNAPVKPEAIYAVDVDLAAEFPVDPLAWRDRTLPIIPPNARVTALKLTDVPAKRVAFETTFDASGKAAAPARAGDAAQRVAKLLPTFRVKRFRSEPFNAEERPWKYQLDVTFALPAGGGAAASSETRSLFLGERQGGADQLGGARELNLLFDLDQPFLDALFPLAEGVRDPGPLPEPKK